MSWDPVEQWNQIIHVIGLWVFVSIVYFSTQITENVCLFVLVEGVGIQWNREQMAAAYAKQSRLF